MSTNAYAGQSTEGQSKAKTALILGIVGLFIFGIILGPLAIVQANKAEALGVKATGGKVLGWIDTIFGLIGIVYMIFALTGAGA